GNHLSTRFNGVSYTGKQYTKMIRKYTGDGRVIDSGVEKYALYPGGFMQDSTYYWYVKDYQGNNVAVMDGSKNLIQEANYYPYGEPWREPDGQPWLYGGNERLRLDGINEYDFNARRYNSAEGCFSQLDPLCEKYPWLSPYAYCGGDPMNLSDPTGLFTEEAEAFRYSKEHLLGAEAFEDPETGEWYLAMDATGKTAYSGEGEMTRFYGIDSPYNSDVFKGKNDPITLLNAFNLSVNAKLNIMEYAAKSKMPGSTIHGTKLVEQTMGKEIGLYFKAFKVGGLLIDGAYLYTQTKGVREKYLNGTLTEQEIGHFLMNVVMTYIGYEGWTGYGLSLGYFLFDAAYGDMIWNANTNINSTTSQQNR
ncbi:MAG: hypothetical protein K2H15_06005, partial [Muribaculaceae bacterium]|nr:hypothetical protein [Muribaculaceae bacterium]